MIMSHATASVAVCFMVMDSAQGGFLRKANTSNPAEPLSSEEAMAKFQEQNLAEEYADSWKDKSWESARRSCDTDKLPDTTDAVVRAVCGKVESGDRCVCNTAKAHACHVGCKKAKADCPKACKRAETGIAGCYAGDPKNGGKKLSSDDGLHGNCHQFCSQPWGPVSYCGAGGMYQEGFFTDCTACDPATKKVQDEKEEWTSCMVGCYPNPSCVTMCSEGTPECYLKCVDDYRHVVEPYWDMFKGSLTAIPLVAKVDGKIVMDVVDPEKRLPPHNPFDDHKNPPEEVFQKLEASGAIEDSPLQDADEMQEVEADDYDYGDGDEGEYVDPFAGENEWEQKGALSLHIGLHSHHGPHTHHAQHGQHSHHGHHGRHGHRNRTKLDADIVRLFNMHPNRTHGKAQNKRWPGTRH